MISELGARALSRTRTDTQADPRERAHRLLIFKSAHD